MYLGKVIGTVVCERKYEGLEGRRLLVVQPLDHLRQPSGSPEVAVDTVSASPGTLVYLVGSREAAIAVNAAQPPPVDAAIVGLVDSVDLRT